ncbi:MAG: hypothetical protein M8467_18720 [Anaerolineae bacterium]|nr:hypothetical protein [Anaerolineae bacterium]
MKHKMAAWLRALLSVGLLATLIFAAGLISPPGKDPAAASPVVLDAPAGPQVFLPAIFRPAEPTPAPVPPPGTIQVFDADGVERDLAWLQDKYGDFIIQPAAEGDGPVYRIAALREQVDIDAALKVHILDEERAPLASIPVAWYWPDAPADPDCGPLGGVLPDMFEGRCEEAATGLDGLTHFFMGNGAGYSPELGQIGPHAVWVYGATKRSDLILGLGMLAGTANDHFNVEYRLEGGEAVPPTPTPSPTPPPPPPPPSSCGGTWDPRLDALGVTLEPAQRAPGESYWCLYEARWADAQEAAGLHHIYLDAVDAWGNRIVGQEMVVEWPGGSVTVIIEDKPPPEYGANFPMDNVLGSYSARVGGSQPSDRIAGMGLGTPEEPDFTIHTCFYLTFKWVP